MSTARFKLAAVLFIAAAVLVTTLALFIDWAPAGALAIYWLSMADLVVLELVACGYALATMLRASNPGRVNRMPFAIHASIASTGAVFFAASVFIDILALRLTTSHPDLEHLFVWVIILKWVLLALIMAVLALLGTEGKEQRARNAARLPGRLDFDRDVDKISGDLRGLSVAEADRPLFNEVTDKVEILRNKARSLTHASTAPGDADPKMKDLVDSLSESVSRLKTSAGADVKKGLTQSRDAAAELIRLLG